MFNHTRTISGLLNAGATFASAVSSGDMHLMLEGGERLSNAAKQRLVSLREERSNDLIERNRVYKDEVTQFLIECCEGLVGCQQVMVAAFGRNDAAFLQGVEHMARYLELVGESAGPNGMSPHAVVGIPSAVHDVASVLSQGYGLTGFGGVIVEELHVITDGCFDVLDLGCVEECPVDCIYIGDRMAYIHPTECIECGACAAACPVGAIFPVSGLPPAQSDFARINAEYFTLPHSHAGSPGGAASAGRSGVDHPDVIQTSNAVQVEPLAEPAAKMPPPKQGTAKRLPPPKQGTAKRLPPPKPSSGSGPADASPQGQRSGIDVKVIPKGSLRATARRLLKRDRLGSAELLFGQLVRFYDCDLDDERALKILDAVAKEVWANKDRADAQLDQSGAGCMSAAVVFLLASLATLGAVVNEAVAVLR